MMIWIIELNPQTCARLPGQRSPPSLLLVQPPLGAEPVGTIAASILIINQINKPDCVNRTLGVWLLCARRRCSAVSFFSSLLLSSLPLLPCAMVQPTTHCNVMAVGSEVPRLAFLFGQVRAHVIKVTDYSSV